MKLVKRLTLADKGPPNTACTRLAGVAAFSSSFRDSKLVPPKWRGLVPPASG